MMIEQEQMEFEIALARLEGVVSRLESGELTLGESLRTFEEGVALSRQCTQRLDKAEAQIELLLLKANGETSTQPFSPSTEREGV